MIDFEQQASPQILIGEIISHARQLGEKKHTDVSALIKFIKLYYAHSSLEDLQTRSIEDLYGAALSHWQLMMRRQPGELKVRIFNPQFSEHGWQSEHTIMEVVTDDMPFLVDSMRMEMNRMGLTVHLMIHMGGMQVIRDKEGNAIDILPFSESHQQAKLESPLYMEIDRQVDPQALVKIRANIIRVLTDVRLAVSDWEAMQRKSQRNHPGFKGLKG